MEILPLHIEYLLTRHDCVIVPGIGALIATDTEARIDIENGKVYPHRREISFNRNVSTDDGLLSHSIARREGLSYEDAHRLMNSLIAKMKIDLHTEGEVSLGMTGRMLKDEEGLISFEPRRKPGLSDIYREEALQDATARITENQKEIAGESNGAEESEDGMRTIRVSRDRYVFTVSKRAVHAAAMLITILTVGLSLLVPINVNNEQKASVISIDEFFRRELNVESPAISDTATKTPEVTDSISHKVVLEES